MKKVVGLGIKRMEYYGLVLILAEQWKWTSGGNAWIEVRPGADRTRSASGMKVRPTDSGPDARARQARMRRVARSSAAAAVLPVAASLEFTRAKNYHYEFGKPVYKIG